MSASGIAEGFRVPKHEVSTQTIVADPNAETMLKQKPQIFCQVVWP